MASQSSVIGLLRVLLSANTAEFDTRLKTSGTVAKDFGTSVMGVAKSLKELSGDALLKSANNTVAAIEKLGGVQKLTAAEQAKVNAQLTTAIEKYTALGIQAPKALTDVANATKQVEQPTSRLGNVLADFGTTFKATLAGMISAQAIIGGVTAAWRTMTEFIASSVKAYSDQEAAVKKMTTALNAQGNATPQVIKQYKDMASQFQQTTVFSDELINEMQALLVQVGDVMPAEMEGALQAATNLASGLGIDLRQATMLVGKAFEGETGTLKRYGIVIDETKLKTQGVTAVLEAIQAKFGGQAQSEAETYAGKLKQIANAWGEVQEMAGEIIISNPIIEATLRDLKTALDGGTGAVIEHQHSWSNLLRFLSGDTAGPLGVLSILVRKLEDAASAANQAARAAQFSPEFIKPAASHVPQALQDAQKLREEAKRLAEEQKKAAESAAAWAKSIAALKQSLSGANLQREVKLLSEAYAGLSKEQRANQFVVDRTAEAAQRLFDQHAVLTPQLFRLIIANGNLAASMPPVVSGMQAVGDAGRLVGDHFEKTLAIANELIPTLKVVAGLGTEFRGVGAIPIPVAPEIEKSVDGLNELIDAVQMLGRVAPGVIGEIVNNIGAMIQGWQLAKAAIEDFGKSGTGVLGKIGAGINLVSGILQIGQALFALGERFFGDRGRDMVESFAASHGGFDRLHEKLLELGDEGERLWIKLTQGVGRNNPLEAQAAIALVAEALAKGAQKTVEATKEIESAGKQLVASLKSELDSLTSEIDSLTQSIANEMPEEVMGIVEQQTRARIAAIEAERDRVEEELRQAGEAIGETAEGVGQTVGEHIGGSIRGIGSDLDRNVGEWQAWARHIGSIVGGLAVGVEIPEPPDGTPGFASGTPNLDFANFGREAQVMLHSREAVVPQSRVGEFAGQVATALGSSGGGSHAGPTIVILEVDRRELGRAMVPVVPNQARRLGVRVRS